MLYRFSGHINYLNYDNAYQVQVLYCLNQAAMSALSFSKIGVSVCMDKHPHLLDVNLLCSITLLTRFFCASLVGLAWLECARENIIVGKMCKMFWHSKLTVLSHQH